MKASTYLHFMCPTEERILEAAIAVLAKEGYGGATTKKIADEAGINEVTLFRKFKNKENLIKAANVLCLKRSLQNMDNMFKTNSCDDLEAGIPMLGKHLSNTIDMKTNLIIMAIGELQRLPASERTAPKYSTAILDHLTQYFDRQIKKGNMRAVDPKIAALSFFSYIFYMNFVWKLNGLEPAGNDEKALEEFIDIFMNGVLQPEKKRPL